MVEEFSDLPFLLQDISCVFRGIGEMDLDVVDMIIWGWVGLWGESDQTFLISIDLERVIRGNGYVDSEVKFISID